MDWFVFSYSLPTKGPSSPRVTLWRRLKRLGAITPTGSLYLLPAHEACLEAFQWLAQEVQQTGGAALVLHVSHVDGMTDPDLISLFRAARHVEYDELADQVQALEQAMAASLAPAQDSTFHTTLTQLRTRHGEIAAIDYFATPSGTDLLARLTRLAQALSPAPPTNTLPVAQFADYRAVEWATRPRPHVDRLACAWFIRRFINPAAIIHYGPGTPPEAVTFDLPGADFGHQGDACTFETMLQRFGLADPAVHTLAEIVHDLDLRDGRFGHPEAAGVDLVLQGWLLESIRDTEREVRGIALFEGLYQALRARTRDQEAPG